MTQSRFAQWLGVSVKQVKYLEHQRRNPSGPSRRLLEILAGQSHFSGAEEVMVLGTGAARLKPPSDKPKPPTAPAQPRVTSNPPPPDVESKASADEKVPAVAAPPEVSDDDAFVWR